MLDLKSQVVSLYYYCDLFCVLGGNAVCNPYLAFIPAVRSPRRSAKKFHLASEGLAPVVSTLFSWNSQI